MRTRIFLCAPSLREGRYELLAVSPFHSVLVFDKASTMERFIRIDELKHALFSLRITNELLPKVSDDPLYWIWVIISLHNSLQGFMAAALRSGGLDNQLMPDGKHKRVRTQWENYQKSLVGWPSDTQHEPESHLEARSLSGFMELYEKIQRQDLMEDGRYLGSKKFVPTEEQNESVKALHELRNDYIHFFPKFSLCDTWDFPRMVTDCVDIIHFLAFESGNVLFWKKEVRSTLLQLIPEIRETAAALERAYDDP